MLKKRKRTALFFIFSALIVTVCRCNPDIFGGNTNSSVFSDGSIAMSCKLYTEYLETQEGAIANEADAKFGKPVWECSVACPDGSQVKFDLYEQPAFMVEAKTEEDKLAYKAQYCSAEAMVAAVPSATPTVTPTATPADVPAQDLPIIIPPPNLLIVQPLLSGAITACDLRGNFINFRLAEPLLDINGKTVELTMNGLPANCSIPNSNPSLYSCALPQNLSSFPVQIIVKVDGTEVNNFSFDGSSCIVIEKQEQEEEIPAPVIPPPPYY